MPCGLPTHLYAAVTRAAFTTAVPVHAVIAFCYTTVVVHTVPFLVTALRVGLYIHLLPFGFFFFFFTTRCGWITCLVVLAMRFLTPVTRVTRTHTFWLPSHGCYAVAVVAVTVLPAFTLHLQFPDYYSSVTTPHLRACGLLTTHPHTTVHLRFFLIHGFLRAFAFCGCRTRTAPHRSLHLHYLRLWLHTFGSRLHLPFIYSYALPFRTGCSCRLLRAPRSGSVTTTACRTVGSACRGLRVHRATATHAFTRSATFPLRIAVDRLLTGYTRYRVHVRAPLCRSTVHRTGLRGLHTTLPSAITPHYHGVYTRLPRFTTVLPLVRAARSGSSPPHYVHHYGWLPRSLRRSVTPVLQVHRSYACRSLHGLRYVTLVVRHTMRLPAAVCSSTLVTRYVAAVLRTTVYVYHAFCRTRICPLRLDYTRSWFALPVLQFATTRLHTRFTLRLRLHTRLPAVLVWILHTLRLVATRLRHHWLRILYRYYGYTRLPVYVTATVHGSTLPFALLHCCRGYAAVRYATRYRTRTVEFTTVHPTVLLQFPYPVPAVWLPGYATFTRTRLPAVVYTFTFHFCRLRTYHTTFTHLHML